MSPLSVEAVEIPWPQREQRWPSWLAGRPHRCGLQVRGELRRIPGIIRHWYHRTKNQRTHLVYCGLAPQKKNLYRRDGKGHRCCLGVELIHNLATLSILHQDDTKKGWMAPGWYEERDELHQDDMKKMMNFTRVLWRKGWISPGILWRKWWIAPGWYEETYELHKDDMKKRMNCTRMNCTRMIWRK